MMDPVSTAIIGALSAGAVGGISDTAKKAIVDAYEKLKTIIKNRFGSQGDLADSVQKLEAKPGSLPRREMLAEELQALNGHMDPELLSAAQSILELINALPNGEQQIQIARGTGISQADHGSIATVNIFGPSQRNK